MKQQKQNDDYQNEKWLNKAVSHFFCSHPLIAKRKDKKGADSKKE